jgi:hypothetical protein
MKSSFSIVTMAFLLLFGGSAAFSQEPSPSDKYVTREEYEKLQKELDAVKAQLQQLLQQKAAPAAETEQAFDDMEKEIKGVKAVAEASKLGTTKFLLAGDAWGGFTTRRGEDAAFSAAFDPVFLWKISDRLFAESKLEIEHEDNDVTISLETAQLSFLLNDYMTICAGKFLNPSNFYDERQHAAWIHKLPDDALAVHGSLLAESLIGFQVRGGIPVGPTKLGYAFFVANAPSLITDDPEAAGALEFDNFNNLNGHIATGGRIGFLPIPQLEIGYGFEISDVGTKGTSFGDVGALLQSVDLSYVRDSNLLKGVVDFRAEWVWSHVDKATYDIGSGPFTFSNNRNGGYVQLAYRPTKVGWEFVRDFEGVLRFDRLNQPSGAPGAFDEQRWTLGLNYWFAPSTVLKAAYQFDDKRGGEDQNAFLLQAVMGF